MDAIITWLNGRSWLNALFLLLALAGVLSSLMLYFRGKREKLACYNRTSFPLILDTLSKMPTVQILYMGQPIRDLILTKVAIWNRGRDPIEFEDCAPAEPLRVDDESDGMILGAEVSQVTNPANRFGCVVSQDKRKVSVNFDYFGHNEGVVLNVYHTGASEKLLVRGFVKGYQQIEHREAEPDPCMGAADRLYFRHVFRFIRKLPWVTRFLVALVFTLPLLPFLMVFIATDWIIARFRSIPATFRLTGVSS
jgi:hypothetical protein